MLQTRTSEHDLRLARGCADGQLGRDRSIYSSHGERKKSIAEDGLYGVP
jgi:hypothetical protein